MRITFLFQEEGLAHPLPLPPYPAPRGATRGYHSHTCTHARTPALHASLSTRASERLAAITSLRSPSESPLQPCFRRHCREVTHHHHHPYRQQA
eukprot:scaffold63588_cov59-Phaeocystis_antarctica.AAC.2